MKQNTKKIALLALMVALTTIFCFVPVTIGTVSLALMILPLLVIANVEDFKMTVALAIWLAVINQIAWFTTKAGSPLAVAFQDPMVCMFPRIMIGLVVWLVNRGLKKVLIKSTMDKKTKVILEQVVIVIASAIGVVTNTALCAAFTLLFHTGANIGTSGIVIDSKYILAWFGLNFIIELITFSIITPPIVLALKQFKIAGVNENKKKEIIEAEIYDANALDNEVSKDEDEDVISD